MTNQNVRRYDPSVVQLLCGLTIDQVWNKMIDAKCPNEDAMIRFIGTTVKHTDDVVTVLAYYRPDFTVGDLARCRDQAESCTQTPRDSSMSRELEAKSIAETLARIVINHYKAEPEHDPQYFLAALSAQMCLQCGNLDLPCNCHRDD